MARNTASMARSVSHAASSDTMAAARCSSLSLDTRTSIMRLPYTLPISTWAPVLTTLSAILSATSASESTPGSSGAAAVEGSVSGSTNSAAAQTPASASATSGGVTTSSSSCCGSLALSDATHSMRSCCATSGVTTAILNFCFALAANTALSTPGATSSLAGRRPLPPPSTTRRSSLPSLASPLAATTNASAATTGSGDREAVRATSRRGCAPGSASSSVAARPPTFPASPAASAAALALAPSPPPSDARRCGMQPSISPATRSLPSSLLRPSSALARPPARAGRLCVAGCLRMASQPPSKLARKSRSSAPKVGTCSEASTIPTSPAPPPPRYTTLPPPARAAPASDTNSPSRSTCEYAAAAAPSKAARHARTPRSQVASAGVACAPAPSPPSRSPGAEPTGGEPQSGENAAALTAVPKMASSNIFVAVPPLRRVDPCTASGPTTGVSTCAGATLLPAVSEARACISRARSWKLRPHVARRARRARSTGLKPTSTAA
mmetsp:Transcript_8749/g.35743  ORF Transcript_8749/g.35743 Transcript_8749/m.35743 type:complete len:497 (-) Transcript_8749:601-2091(-)